MKNWKVVKKQMKRLNKALAYSDRYIVEESGRAALRPHAGDGRTQ